MPHVHITDGNEIAFDRRIDTDDLRLTATFEMAITGCATIDVLDDATGEPNGDVLELPTLGALHDILRAGFAAAPHIAAALEKDHDRFAELLAGLPKYGPTPDADLAGVHSWDETRALIGYSPSTLMLVPLAECVLGEGQ